MESLKAQVLWEGGECLRHSRRGAGGEGVEKSGGQ